MTKFFIIFYIFSYSIFACNINKESYKVSQKILENLEYICKIKKTNKIIFNENELNKFIKKECENDKYQIYTKIKNLMNDQGYFVEIDYSKILGIYNFKICNASQRKLCKFQKDKSFYLYGIIFGFSIIFILILIILYKD